MLVLGRKDLETILDMASTIGAIEQAFLALSAGACRVPERLLLEIPERGATLLAMPAYQGGPEALGAKLVSVFPNNRARGLDVVQAAYVLLEAESGRPLALMEGNFLTGIRTAATSALATKFLAREDAARLAVFGAGTQARFHIEAMCAVRPVRSLTVSSRTRSRAEQLAREAAHRFGLEAQVVDAAEALAGAEIICTCTSSREPLFDGRLIEPGAHINAVGAFGPAMRELDAEAVRRARIVVDTRAAAMAEAGDLLVPIAAGVIGPESILAELAEVVSGRRVRESAQDITLFKSVGYALEDLAAARLAYSRALERHVGIEIEW